MANLRVDKITSTETFETTGSVQFDGSGDYLRSTTNLSDYQFGTGDFTVEAWIYKSANGSSNYDGLCAYGTNGSGDDGWMFEASATRGYVFWIRSTEQITFNETPNTSQWIHTAVTRKSGVIRLFVNGVLKQERISTTEVKTTGTSFDIGAYAVGTGNYYFNGHISNLRVVKGKAFYTADFKPPMRELEVTPETSLLACQSKTDASLEKTGKTITVNGNAVASELTPGILTPIPKAGAGSAIKGSVEFDKTNDYLEVADNGDFDASGDFTIEFWANLALTQTNGWLISKWYSGSNEREFLINGKSDGVVEFYWSTDGNTHGSLNTPSGTITANQWNHYAWVKNGSVLTGYINGVALVSKTDLTSQFHDSSNSLYIGTISSTGTRADGFISNLRIVKGTALYTDNFIPPTRELKKVPGTVLLCCQDPNDPTTEATGKTITGHGNLDTDTYSENLITNGNFTTSASDGWTVVEGTGTTVLGTAQSGTFGDGNHLVLTATSGSFVFLAQQFTTKIGSTYLVNVQSNGADESFISTDSDKDNAIITDIRNTGGNNPIGDQTFVATQTSYHMILRGGTGGGNFDTASVYKVLTPNGASNFTPQVGDDRKVTFEGVTKVNSDAYFYLPTGDTVTRDSRSGRGVLGGGQNPGNVGTIDFVTIQSMGNSLDFGDLNQTGQQGGCSSSTRGLFANGSNSNTIDFITIPTTGNALDFGDRTVSLNGVGALSSNTRGVFLGGGSPVPQSDVMDYVTIASKGDAIDFGNLTTANKNPAGCSSPVRGVIAMGGSPAEVNTIDFITIASTGNSLDFGDCTEVGEGRSAFSSSIRGIFTGSYSTPTVIDVIQYVTISSKGNATDFGNLVLARTEGAGTSDSIRGLSFGGFTPGSPITPQNIIDYVTITTTGNAKDFGDLTQARQYPGACSDSHGGLG